MKRPTLRRLPGLLVLGVGLALSGCGERPEQVAIRLCQEKIETRLKSPASAQYPSLEAEKDLLASLDGGTFVEVKGQVDSANSFGTLLRSDLYCLVDFAEPDRPAVQAFLGEKAELEAMQAAGRLREKYHDLEQREIRQRKLANSQLAPPDVVSYQEFLRLQEGMSLERIEEIVGEKGTKVPQDVRVGSRQGATYEWTNHDGSSLRIYFDRERATVLIDEGLW